MADETVEITYVVKDKATGELKEINKQMDHMSSTAERANRGGGIFKMALGVAGGMALLNTATAGFRTLTSVMSESVDLAREQAAVERGLNAVLESTGYAAGLSADELKSMASELQAVTNYGDEATIAAQSLLLTFTNIGEDVFPEVTETVLDMSTAFGQDLKSSAIQLGKALNDPIEGLGSLSRIGVQFTEEQEDLIKAMVEAGDVAGAQGIILAELGTQVGGAARAAYEPTTGLMNAWGDFKEELGNAVLPILDELAEQALPYVQESTEKLVLWVDDLIESFGGPAGIQEKIETFISYVTTTAIPWLGNLASGFGDIVGTIREAIAELEYFTGLLGSGNGPIGALFSQPSWKAGLAAPTAAIPGAGIVNPANQNSITQNFYGATGSQAAYDATFFAMLDANRTKGR